jgi:hypothetical protein
MKARDAQTFLAMKSIFMPLTLLACVFLANCAEPVQMLESKTPVIIDGQGGTREVHHSHGKPIDVWTTGTPPRRFQVVGYVESSGLGGIADKVYSVGGDAAIIVAKGTRYLGSVSNSSNWSNGSGSTYGGGFNFSGSGGAVGVTMSIRRKEVSFQAPYCAAVPVTAHMLAAADLGLRVTGSTLTNHPSSTVDSCRQKL